VRLSKGGAAAAQKNDATSATHDENGYYRVPLNATDTNTEGTLDVCVSVAGALPVVFRYEVLPAEVFDAIVGGTDKLQVDLVQTAGSAVSGVNDFKADVSGLPTSSQIADAVWDEAQSGHTTAGTFGLYLDAAVSGVSTGGVSAADIADAVWDEALAGHVVAGSAGKALADAEADADAHP